MRRSLAASLVVALAMQPVAVTQPAKAQLAVVCPLCVDKYDQLMNYAKQAQQVEESITMRVAQAQMLRNQVTNMVGYPTQVWNQISQNFASTQSLYQKGRQLMLSASMASGQLRSYASMVGANVPDMQTRYREWSEQSNDNVTATLAGFGLQRDQMAADRDVVNQIRSRSAGAEGMKQALQANTEMGGAQVNELHRLRELIMEDARMKANALHLASVRQATGEAETTQFFDGQQMPETGNRRY